MIRLIKWSLFAVCCAWAAYSIYGLWVLSQISAWLDRLNGTVAMAHPAASGLFSNALAVLQAGAVTLGPAMVAALFLAVRWPSKRPAGNSG